MRLRQDIEISYEIRSNERTKRRGGVFSPRKGGGRSNLPSMIGSDDILSPKKPISPQKQSPKNTNNQYLSSTNERSPPSSPKKKISRPTSAPSQRPKSAEVPQRVRKAATKPADTVPWNSSTGNVDREYLLLLQDNEISKFRQAAWDIPISARPTTANIGASHENDRKTITTSYSRCREARTSGPILNISSHHVGYAQKTAERISEITSTGIHDTRWNVSTKDRDEEPRARPEIPFDSKSSYRFHETFYSQDAWRNISSRGVMTPSQQSPMTINKTWDDIKKVPLDSKILPQSKFKVR